MTDLILSIDDYNPGNIELAKLIKSYGLESNTIFFIDLGVDRKKAMTGSVPPPPKAISDQIVELSRMGFELGSHLLYHDNDFKNKSKYEQERQIKRSKDIIKGLTGKECRYLAYCRGRSNKQIRQIVKDSGYISARNTTVLKTARGDDLFNMPTTFHLCPIRKEYEGRDLDRVFDEQLAKGKGYFHYWLHVFELDKYELWKTLEGHLQKISKLV